MLAKPADKRSPKQIDDLYDYYLATRDAEFAGLAAALDSARSKNGSAIRTRGPVDARSAGEDRHPPMANILMRGEYDKRATRCGRPTRRPAAAARGGAAQPPRAGPVAACDRTNPLTARVTVNRFWQELFGRGLVGTSEDFGVMGEQPSHPELLDWLAVEFREQGWDVKRFFKLMLMSATYRQAAIATPEKLEKDRDNVLLSRGPRFRMDAEMVRDYALAASGLLASKMGGPEREAVPAGRTSGKRSAMPGGNTREYKQDKGENLYRRTLYNFWKRMAPPPNSMDS